jgi:hypothetical protein
MVMAGHSKAEIVSALKAAFDNKQLPDLESGVMAFMMSKSAYLYDAGGSQRTHLILEFLRLPYRAGNLANNKSGKTKTKLRNC